MIDILEIVIKGKSVSMEVKNAIRNCSSLLILSYASETWAWKVVQQS